jgi:hypothetical protein
MNESKNVTLFTILSTSNGFQVVVHTLNVVVGTDVLHKHALGSGGKMVLSM